METLTLLSSTSQYRRLLLGLILLVLPRPGVGQTSPSDEVKAVVERFLLAAGNNDLDALAGMFAPGASIASASLRQGSWVTASQSFDAWLAMLRTRPPGPPYQEPVTEFTVHVDDDRLAFVRADARLIRDGVVRSHNIDYFTLLRDSTGTWKFVNGSYTTKPVQR